MTDLLAETLKVEFQQMGGFANRRFDFQVPPSNGKMAMCDSVRQGPQKSGCGIFSLSKRPPWIMAHMVDREEQDLLVALLLLSHDEGDIDHDEFLLLLVALEEGNPCPLNQAIGRRLCFDLLDEETCLRRSRFSKDQLTELCQLLRLPDKMSAACRTTWSGLEGLEAGIGDCDIF